MPTGVKICEGEYVGIIHCETDELLAAYSNGFRAGAGSYGSGGADIFTRKDLPNLDPNNESDAVIISLIQKHLPESESA